MDVILLLIFMTGCAIWDRRTGKIPNIWILSALISFLLLKFIRGPSEGAGVLPGDGAFLFLTRTALTAGFLFPLFLFRMMGAGDIKMMAVMSGCLGIDKGFEVVFYGLAAAAAWSFFYMVRRHILIQRIVYFLNYIKNLLEMKQILPYYRADRDGTDIAFCLAPFIWCGFCVWLAVRGGAL